MISPLELKILDENSEYLGISVSKLMDNAGEALADVVAERFNGKKILFICGTGNNGGDGLVAARILKADVALFSRPKTELAVEQYDKLEKAPFDYSPALLKQYDVLIDCVLGTGLKGPVREPYRTYIEDINKSGKTIVSCDIPSGLGSTSGAVLPDITVTFHDTKTGMNKDNCGELIVKNIGIPPTAYDIVGPGDMLRYPIPDKGSHKGQNGSLLIIGGGPYVGAPAMAGMAALRIGADLVHIATPDSSFIPIASFSTSYIVHRLPGDHLSPDDTEELLELSKKMDAVLIGPGLGQDPETAETVRSFIERCDRPMIVDADGINALTGMMPKKHILYTPHRMELRRLIGDKDPDDAASEMGCIIVQKGPEDRITDGEHVRVNRTGTPAMTVGGTGDVLAGAIAGLVAKGMTMFDAGCLGTYICGRSGELSFEEYSYGLTAEDIIDNIGKVLKKEL